MTEDLNNGHVPLVLNVYKDPSARSRPDSVYIGRPGPWGNPFVIGEGGTREEVIEKYRGYLRDNPEFAKLVKRELKGKNLVCFCAPKPCHGDVLLALANGLEERKVPEKNVPEKKQKRTQSIPGLSFDD